MADIHDYNCRHTEKTIPCKETVPKKRNINWFNIVKKIGKGYYGTVYTARTNKGDLVVLKIINVADRSLDIEYEICNQSLASQYNISPRILDYWICGEGPNYAAVVMEYGGNMTLRDLLINLSTIEITDRTSLKRALGVYTAMLNLYRLTFLLFKKCEISHQDLNLENVLVRTENGMVKSVKIIDYGKSQKSKDLREVLNRKIVQPTNLADKSDGVLFMKNNFFIDILMPLCFFNDAFVKEGREFEPKNPIFKWFYKDFAVNGVYHNLLDTKVNQWFGGKDDDAYFYSVENMIDNVISGLEDRLEDESKSSNRYYLYFHEGEDGFDFTHSVIKIFE